MKDYLSKLLQKLKKTKVIRPTDIQDSSLPRESTSAISTKGILRQQLIRLLVIVGASLLVIILVIMVAGKINSKDPKDKKTKEETLQSNQPLPIELASNALDPEKMWRNHFEDKLSESSKKLDEKLGVITESFSKKEQDIERTAKEQLAHMQEQLNFAREELLEATQELKLTREANNKIGVKENFIEDFGNMQIHKIDNDHGISGPKSSRHFIPETAYVKGVLLGGISVSTSVGASAEPTPVIIRITDRGNLPKNFNVNLKTCKILGSSYGDLSSERAVIRAEVMSCTDSESEQIITTKIAGMIFGDDGVNGIKGKIVQTSNKQLQHAFVGGLLSGFSNTAKSAPQFALSGVGTVSTTNAPLGERLRDNSLAGLGNAGEKIADYYLKQAESMSPVLQIPAGSRVDVIFTKGVYLGSSDVRTNLERDRRKNLKEDQQ